MNHEASSNEYELRNVRISIHLPGGEAPCVNEVDGDWQYIARQSVLE